MKGIQSGPGYISPAGVGCKFQKNFDNINSRVRVASSSFVATTREGLKVELVFFLFLTEVLF